MSKLVIVVLGAPNDDQGNLSSMARERSDQALAEFARHPDAWLLPTGGFGEHFNNTGKPHWHYTKRYLAAHGVPETRILDGVDSRSTIQDASLAKPVVERHGLTDLIVVTSDFHVPRARFLFEREFPGLPLTFAAAKTHLPADELARCVQHEEKALARLKNSG